MGIGKGIWSSIDLKSIKFDDDSDNEYENLRKRALKIDQML